MKLIKIILILFSIITLYGCGSDSGTTEPVPGSLQLTQLRVGSTSILADEIMIVANDRPVVATFSQKIDTISTKASFSLIQLSDESEIPFTIAYLDDFSSVSLIPTEDLLENEQYRLEINEELLGINGESFAGFSKDFKTINSPLEVVLITIDGQETDLQTRIQNVALDPKITISFNSSISPDDLDGSISSFSDAGEVIDVSRVNDSTVQILFGEALPGLQRVRLDISTGLDVNEKPFDGFSLIFYTTPDLTPKFPQITDEELLTKVQESTFKYFYDFGHPVSGLTRERNASGDLVTIGGSGFGLMAIIVGIERGFVSREDGVNRLETIVKFLANKADRFRGVWSHWLGGTSGNTIPFSSLDDGGDLVETSLLVQGLLTVRQYLDPSDMQEAELIGIINQIWEEVEWDWHVQEGANQLTWHWSPNFDFQLNLSISGWNESLITYLLAASSPTHTIDKNVYDEGWARNGGMVNGGTFYDITLPLGENRGGPLFFSHYSFLGLDPRNLSDQYASSYFDQNEAHTRINRAYCIDNPRNYVGYSSQVWGLTASDNHIGYSAHSPNNDLGVITPTAAISSIPYTPQESIEALKFFYYVLGDKLWGEYGFYDAFNITEGWYASSYLAIDQGPIIVMIENYRTGLLWDLFMSAPEIQDGLDKLGFTY